MNVKELKEFLKDIDDDVEVFYCIQRWCDNTGYYTNVLTLNNDDISSYNKRVIIGKQ